MYVCVIYVRTHCRISPLCLPRYTYIYKCIDIFSRRPRFYYDEGRRDVLYFEYIPDFNMARVKMCVSH